MYIRFVFEHTLEFLRQRNPISHVLVDLFDEYANPEYAYSETGILGHLKDTSVYPPKVGESPPHIDIHRGADDKVILELWIAGETVTVSAGKLDTGLHLLNTGYEKVYGIEVSPIKSHVLPSRSGAYVYGFLNRLSGLASQHGLSLSEQPKFFETARS